MRKIMINAPIYVFDSIGARFSVLNNDLLIGQPLVGYNTLTDKHTGSYIPYLARNNESWEIGVGFVEKSDNKIVVKRTQVISSSNKNGLVEFGQNTNNAQFYIFANESGFNAGFNNVVVKDASFDVESVKAVYLVDAESSLVEARLPAPEDSRNIVVEFKLINSNHSLYIRDNSQAILDNLSEQDTYAAFVCDGTKWLRLDNGSLRTFSSFSSDQTFSALSDPSGTDLSFQYKDGTNFSGADFYYGADSTLLLGADTAGSAHAIIPVNGSGTTIFNADNQNANFVIEGSGTRNLFFDYRGRLGLNIPSGSLPSTIVHIINSTCKEGIRLENRTSCHPANMTLYYKPSSSLSANETVGEINLSAKDTAGNQTDFVQLQSIAMSNTAGTPKGQFNVSVATSDAAGTGVKTIQTNPDLTFIGYSGDNSISLNKSGSAIVGYSGANVTITSSAVNVTGTNINLNGAVNFGSNTLTSNGSLYANFAQISTLKLQGISEGSVLSVDASGNAVAGSSVKLPSLGSGYVLTTTSGGSVTGIYQTSDYFLTNGDILWNKYQTRDCTVAVREIIPTDDVPVSEYAVGDQVEVDVGGTKYYRNIQDIVAANDVIASILLNQNITTNTVATGTITSVNKGGYLSMERAIEAGTATSGTSNILSIRPGTDTVFNSNNADINFSVYGVDQEPALKVQANAGTVKVPSGIYHAFATVKTTCEPCSSYEQIVDTEAFPIVATTGGVGLSTSHSSANFNYTATGIFSGMLTSVGTNGLPSYYGTYDQNGNAAEWVEDSSASSISSNQYVAGGSWKTELNDNIGASGLKSIMAMNRVTGFEEVGFRVAAQYNLTDSENISGADNLNLKFVSVGNPKNISDASTLYLFEYDANNDPDVDDQYFGVEIVDLGTVNRNYRIGTYEVTNDQYVKFLNAVATTDDRDLYKSEMTSSDRGGINRVDGGGVYEYSSKANMGDKPVVFVDYVSAIRFMNWLHNGASLEVMSEDDIDNYLDYGAYDIFDQGAGTYHITKNIYQKYWMPNIHEWHKAAYYEPINGTITAGSSAVMVKREDPYVVATGYDANGDSCKTLANLSVSGWLYVDHIIVGDGTIRSAKKFANCGDLTTTDTGTGTGTSAPPTTDEVFDNANTTTGGGTTSCEGADCPDVGLPSVGGGTIGDSGSTTDDACSGDDPPPYCDANWDGPTWY